MEFDVLLAAMDRGIDLHGQQFTDLLSIVGLAVISPTRQAGFLAAFSVSAVFLYSCF